MIMEKWRIISQLTGETIEFEAANREEAEEQARTLGFMQYIVINVSLEDVKEAAHELNVALMKFREATEAYHHSVEVQEIIDGAYVMYPHPPQKSLDEHLEEERGFNEYLIEAIQAMNETE